MDILSGNGVVAPIGATVKASVYVTDLFGAPVRNATIHFAVTGGGGSVFPASVQSDVNGIAAVSWTLGKAPGTNALAASAYGIATPVLHGPRGASDFLPHQLSYGCGRPPCAFPAQTFDPFVPKYVNFHGVPDAQVPSPDDGEGGVDLKLGKLVFSATGRDDPRLR